MYEHFAEILKPNSTDAKLPAENRQGLMAEQAANFERLKHVCETNPA